MRIPTGATPPLVAFLVLAGCGDAMPSLPPAIVVDSAGVRVVAYDLEGALVPAFRAVGEPDLRIGVQDGEPEYTLSGVTDATFGPDGTVVVSDRVAAELRVYDAAGRWVRSIGGRGEGPGEFVAAPSILAAGDTVLAFDPGNGRITRFSGDGGLLGTVTPGAGSAIRVRAVTRLSDGSLLAQSRWIAPDAGAPVPHDVRLELDSIVVTRTGPDGLAGDTVALLADRVRARMVMDRGGGIVGVAETVTPWAARAVVVGAGTSAVVGRTHAFALERLGPEGRVTSALRVIGVDPDATADEIRAHQESVVRQQAGGKEVDPVTWKVNMDFLPERLPAFADVVAGAGQVWVARSALDTSAGIDWLVFDDAWALLGTVRTPPGAHLFAIGADALLASISDDLGVPYVVRYPLGPPTG